VKNGEFGKSLDSPARSVDDVPDQWEMSMPPTCLIDYGERPLPLVLDPDLADWRVLTPRHTPPLADARAAFVEACRSPIASAPLREVVAPGDCVVVVTSDGTRPVPNRQLIPWLLDELPTPAERVTVLVGNGTHRANTPAELDAMFGNDVRHRVRIENHDAFDGSLHTVVGRSADGVSVAFNRAYVEADKRIVVGFIEPHFFAGFSGGPKAVAPGVAGIETIFGLHRYDLIAHPCSAYGRLEDNPLQAALGEAVALCPPDFLVNVTLNADKAITGIFAGHYEAAHRVGCARVREDSMVPVNDVFPVVIASNSGFPLDQNLYQSVKGMAAAERIVDEEGIIVMASECRDGVPDVGRFRELLASADSIGELDTYLRELEAPVLDQWQAQVLARIRRRCSVALYSELPDDVVRACHLTPIDAFQEAVDAAVRAAGRWPPVAVLPQGPTTTPFIVDRA